METVLSYIKAGKNDGARLVAGGERTDIGTGKGYFIQPHLRRRHPDHQHRPRRNLRPRPGHHQVQRRRGRRGQANATVYGLAAAVWTRDVSKAHRVARAVKAGTVWVNTYNLYDPALPFGGFKESGFGRDQGRDALEKYTQTKSVWVNL